MRLSSEMQFFETELLFQKQQIGIIILRLFSKTFLMIFSYLKALIWTISFFFLSIAPDRHPNHFTGDPTRYDIIRQINYVSGLHDPTLWIVHDSLLLSFIKETYNLCS